MRNGWESWGVNSQYHSMPDWSQDWEFSYVSSVSRAGSRVLESLGSVRDQTSVLQALKVYYMLSVYLDPVPHPCLSIFWKSRRPTQQPQELLGVPHGWCRMTHQMQVGFGSSFSAAVWRKPRTVVKPGTWCRNANFVDVPLRWISVLIGSMGQLATAPSADGIQGTHRSSECLLTHRRPFLCLLVPEFTAQFPDPWGT